MPNKTLNEAVELLGKILSANKNIKQSEDDIIKSIEGYPELLEKINNIKEKEAEIEKLINSLKDSTYTIESLKHNISLEELEKNKDSLAVLEETRKKLVAKLKLKEEELKKITEISEEEQEAFERNQKLVKEQLEDRKKENDLIDKRNERIKIGVNLFKTLSNLSDYALKKEDELAKNRPTFGFSQREYEETRRRLFSYGKEAEQIGVNAISLEGKLTRSIGAQSKIVLKDLENYALLTRATGLGEDGTVDILNTMRGLGSDIEESSKTILNLIDLSKKSGLSSEKVINNFKKDLQIAQNYTFKNGINGLKEMSVYSEKMRINMSSVASLADKISSPEEAIKLSANLQVLGGSFSALSDPLKLLHMGINDMEGLTTQYSKMLNNIGTINKETGEITIGGYERLRLKAASQAMGVSIDEMMNTVRTKLRRRAIQADIDTNLSLRGNSQAIDFLSNTAQKRDGKWSVEVGGEYKAITSLSEDDIRRLKPDEALMSDLAYNVSSIKDMFERQTNAANASIAKGLLPLMTSYQRSLNSRNKSNFESKGLTLESYTTVGLTVIKSMDIKMSVIIGQISAIIGRIGKLGGGIVGGGPMRGNKLGRMMNSGMGRGIGAVTAVGAGINTWSQFSNNNTSAGIGSVAGSVIGGLGGFFLSGMNPMGAVYGASLGNMVGTLIGDSIGNKNADSEGYDVAHDVIIPSKGKPIKLNKEDDIIAAKPNGAIDKYFKNSRGEDPYIPNSNNSLNLLIDKLSKKDTVGDEIVNNNKVIESIPNGSIDKYFKNAEHSNYVNEKNNNIGDNSVTVTVPPIKIDGVIRLEANGTQLENINIKDLLTNNLFKREVTKIITNELNKNTYGGKIYGNTFNN